MFDKILIANRGEIACRIIHTARRMGVATVAVYSEADASARHVALADEAVLLGPAPATESYLRVDRLVEAARRAGSLDADRIRGVLLKLETNTAFGAFKVDEDGVQIGHKILMFQWQDGKKAMVWPEKLAAGQPRFPTPPWGKR